MKKLLIALTLIGAIYALSLPVQSYLLIKAAGKASLNILNLMAVGTRFDEYMELLSESSKVKSSREDHVELYKAMTAALANKLRATEPSCRLGYDRQAENRVTALCRISFNGPNGKLIVAMDLEEVSSSGEWKVIDILAKLD